MKDENLNDKPVARKAQAEKQTDNAHLIKAPATTITGSFDDNKQSMTWLEFIEYRFTRVL